MIYSFLCISNIVLSNDFFLNVSKVTWLLGGQLGSLWTFDLQMIQDRWDGEPIGGTDSESDISDVEDPDCCPPTEQGQSDTEESDESSEEEMDIVSNRMSSYWA